MNSNSIINKLVKKVVEETLKHHKNLSKDEIVKKALEKITLFPSSSSEDDEKEVDDFTSSTTPLSEKNLRQHASASTPVAIIEPTFAQHHGGGGVGGNASSSSVDALNLVSPVQRPISRQECGLGVKISPPLPSLLLGDPAVDEDEPVGDDDLKPLPEQPQQKTVTESTASTNVTAAHQPQKKEKVPKTLVSVVEPPSVDGVVCLLKNNEKITFCLRLLSRGQKVGKICGEKATVGQEFFDHKEGVTAETRVSSILCKKCSALQQKNPLLKLIASSEKPKATTKSAASTTATNKKQSTENASVASGLPDDLSGLPIFGTPETEEEEVVSAAPVIPDVLDEVVVSSNGFVEENTHEDQVENGPSATTTSSADLKSLGIESVPKSSNTLFITRSKLSKDNHRIVLKKGKEGDEYKFLMIGRVDKKKYEELLSALPSLSSTVSSLTNSLEEISTEEEALDFLLDNKIHHYQYKNEGDIALFEENEDT